MSSIQTLEVPGYQVVQYLGSGARSAIWQIKDAVTGKDLALKRVARRESSDLRFLQMAINEYNVASRLDHPGIRKVYRLRRVRQWLSLREVHLYMEWCPGRSVHDSRPTNVVEAVRIFTHAAAALAYMNGRGFVHADMKPNNIIVGPGGEVKIIDLGQSCPVGTVKERIQGTRDFIAPEQVYRQPLDSRTDAFNFGAALYWTLTGKPIPTVLPEEHKSSLKSDLIIVPPDKINDDVPSSLSKLVVDCVESSPSRRPESMSVVSSRLNLIQHTLTRRDSGKSLDPK